MPIGTNLGLILPSTEGSWGNELDTALTTIAEAVEGNVPVTALDISASLDMSNQSVIGTKNVAFDAQITSPTALRSIYFDLNGELVCRDGSNNIIPLTLSGSLNTSLSGSLGNTGGNYGTGGITLDWDGTRYNCIGTSSLYTPIRMSGCIIHDNIGNQVTMVATTISSNYTVTWPGAAANPTLGGSSVLLIDNSGNLTFSGQSYTSRKKVIDFLSSVQLSGSVNIDEFIHFYDDFSGPTTWCLPINLEDGDEINSIVLNLYGGGTSSCNYEISLKAKSLAGFTATVATSSLLSVVPGANTITISGLTSQVDATTCYTLVLDASASSGVGEYIESVVVEYTRP